MFEQAYAAITCNDINEKLEHCQQLIQTFHNTDFKSHQAYPVIHIEQAGGPKQVNLIDKKQLKQRGFGHAQNRASLLHSLVHIEFNAINIALDAIYRFQQLPQAYYKDWLSVVADETRHFNMLRKRLADYDHQYGDFPSHAGLWQACLNSGHDVLIRMAIAPRVFEARGLDVTEKMIAGLRQAQDHQSADLLQIIFDDEIRHVRIGSDWFKYLCQQRNLDPESSWLEIIRKYLPNKPRGPFNQRVRLQAGFSLGELAGLREWIV